MFQNDPGFDSIASLPDRARRLIADVEGGHVLGASRQLRLIGDAMIILAEGYDGTPAQLPTLVRELVDHLVVTRGASSQAITNGLHLMVDTALTASVDDRTFASLIIDGVHGFRASLAQGLAQLESQGSTLLPATGTVLLYDYSSSVSALVRNASAAGAHLTVVIPEARSLAGGQHYLPDLLPTSLHLRLIPDAAVSWALRDVDLVLVGAETLSIEGGCYNTIGTELLARLASQSGIPFYVVSLLLKVDRSDGSDGMRAIPLLDFAKSLGPHELPDGAADLDCSFPDLDYTPPGLVTGVVTERGILTPQQVSDAVPAVAVLTKASGSHR